MSEPYPAGCCSSSQTCSPGRLGTQWACSSRPSALCPCGSSFCPSGCWCWWLRSPSSPRRPQSRTPTYLRQEEHTCWGARNNLHFDAHGAKAGKRPPLLVIKGWKHHLVGQSPNYHCTRGTTHPSKEVRLGSSGTSEVFTTCCWTGWSQCKHLVSHAVN